MKKILFVFLLVFSSQSIYAQCDQCDEFYLSMGFCIVDGGCNDSSALNYSGEACSSETFINESCDYGASGCTCSESYNYDPSAVVNDGSCIILSGGCSDSNAENYSGDSCSSAIFASEDCQYGSVELGEFSYTITDANMTVQVGADVVTFNGEEPPIGALLGAFFTNDAGELQCAGFQPWTGDQLAIAVWASESGLDNGFAAGESITWGLSIGGQSFAASTSIMNSSPPFSNTFTSNGFGQLLGVEFSGELTSILGCTDDTAVNYNSNATLDDGSCYSLVWAEPNTGSNASIAVTPDGNTMGQNFSILTFNGEPLPVGSYLGVFFTNDDGQYVCGGIEEWTGENIAMAAWGSETGEDNGFQIGEEYILFAQIYGQSFLASEVEWVTTPPFTNTYALNGFGLILNASFEGEITSTPGCMDQAACNYDLTATVDDGSCSYADGLYDCDGICYNDADGDTICDDEDNCPNDAENDADGDGVCESDEINGCTDSQACNYDSSATEDNGTCIQPITWYWDTDGDGLGDGTFTMEACSQPGPEFVTNIDDLCPLDPENDADGDGVCESDEVEGCTGSDSINYNPDATEDDGSCIIAVPGCMDFGACNFDTSSNIDDGSCEYTSCADCAGVPFGNSVLDNCGTCDNDTSNDCMQDCAGEWGGDAVLDNCGTCDNDASNDCVQDCAGEWGGAAVVDNCGTCDDDASNDCVQDCTGEWGGDAVVDNCGTCDDDVSNDCTTDCAGVFGGDAVLDNCGTCDNDTSNDCVQDCAGEWGGNAIVDNCGTCDDDASNDCVQDCTGEWGGNAVLDECGTCDNDVSNDCVQDCTGEWGGDAVLDNCGTCDNDVSNDCVQDCAGEWGGNAVVDNCGTCDDDASNDCVQDCAGEWGGNTVLDDCGECGGDNSSCTGCTDSSACNYLGATIDDGSCEYPEEGYDCLGELLPVDSPWGNNLGCDPFNNHTVAFNITEGIEVGDYVGLFFTDENGNLVFSQGTEYLGDIFYFTVCGDDETTEEKDGFSEGEEFVWQIFSSNLDCSLPLSVEYNQTQPSQGEYTANGISEVIGLSYDELTLELVVVDVDCNGQNNGLINALVSGGSGNYTFEWSNGQNTQAITDLSPGFYSVVVSDDNGCMIEESEIEITEPEELIITANVSNVSCFGGNDGSIDITVTGGTGDYTYTWVGLFGTYSSDSQDIENLSTGSYGITVTDANGCLGVLYVDVIEPEELEVSVTTTNISCNGANDGVADLTVSGGVAPYTILWQGLDTWDGYYQLENLSPGLHYVTVIDSNGCEVSFVEYEITEPEAMAISETHTNISCFGENDGTSDVTVTGGIPPYTFEWSNGSDTEDVFDLGVGTYSVTATDNVGCSISIAFEITEPEELEISVATTNVSCFGANDGSIDITVTGGTGDYTYTWVGLFGTYSSDSQDIENLSTGSYGITVTDANGCLGVLYVDVIEPEELIISETHTNVSCFGANDGSIDITVTGGDGDYSFYWDNAVTDYNPNQGALEDVSGLGAGVFTVIVSDGNLCSASVEIEITEPEELIISFNSSAGEYLDCNSGQVFALVEGGVSPYSYEWSNGENSPSIFGLCAGDYSVTVTDANGCSISGSATVDLLIPEGWEVNETSFYHEITIPSDANLLLDGVDLNIGDFIGVFFINSEGGLSCGGYTIWEGEETSILAYGAQYEWSEGGSLAGFYGGEQFQWKVYNGETHSGFVIYNDLYSSERYFYELFGQSGIHGAVFSSFQTIPLNENPYTDWDMISTYMNSNNDVESIMSPILNNFIIIKDASGLVYWPAIPVSTLDNLNTQEAYAIKTWAPEEISISGDFVQPEFTSNQWAEGWNFISYPRYWSNSVETSLSSVLSDIKLLKDDSGNIFWPELGINTMSNMEAGEGYLLKLNSGSDFSFDSNSDYYPENPFDAAAPGGSISSEVGARYGSDIENFEIPINTYSNMTIGFPESSLNVEDGDELAVFDQLGNLVGVSKLESGNNYIIVWGDDEETIDKDGLLVGEEMTFQLWKKQENKLFNIVPEWSEGDDNFSINGINIAESVIVEISNTVITSMNCFPNPASSFVNLEFSIENDSKLDISLVDNLGKLVYSNSSLFNSGVNRITLPLDNVSKGIYYIEVRGVDFVERLKLDVLY